MTEFSIFLEDSLISVKKLQLAMLTKAFYLQNNYKIINEETSLLILVLKAKLKLQKYLEILWKQPCAPKINKTKTLFQFQKCLYNKIAWKHTCTFLSLSEAICLSWEIYFNFNVAEDKFTLSVFRKNGKSLILVQNM